MIKHNRRILAVALAAVGFTGSAWAQTPAAGLNTVAPGVVARAPVAQSGNQGALGAPSGSGFSAPAGTSAPVMGAAPGGVFDPLGAGPESAPSNASAHPDRVTIAQTNMVRARTELLRAQMDQAKIAGDLRKMQDEVKASDEREAAASLQSQLEAAKASDPKAAAAAAAPAPEPEVQVTLLMTYGLDGRRFAEVRVGDSLDTFMVGDRLSTGQVIKSIDNGSMTLAKGKRGKSQVVRMSRSAAQETYSARQQSISAPEAAPASGFGAPAPAALPTLGGNAGQAVLNQLMRQGGIPPIPRQ